MAVLRQSGETFYTIYFVYLYDTIRGRAGVRVGR